MRLVTREEMLTIDRLTSETCHIPPAVLMENAARSVAEWIVRERPAARRILVLFGSGNNGGDGLAAARHLCRLGREVRLLPAVPPERLRGDAAANYRAAVAFSLAFLPVHDPEREPQTAAALESCDLVLDAIFGTGLEAPVRDGRASLIRLVNAAGRETVSIDLPSGLTAAGDGEPVVRADITLAIGLPKSAMLGPLGRRSCGRVVVLDAGFPGHLTSGGTSRWLDAGEAAALLPVRPPAAHKGTMGRLLVLAGSRAYPGAALLAARAALQAGPGLVELAVPEAAGYHPATVEPDLLGTCVPGIPGEGFGPADIDLLAPSLRAANAVVAGPGFGRGPAAGEFLEKLAHAWNGPILLDADALFHHAERLPAFAGPVILTPHPGELARLAARFPGGTDLAAAFQATIVAKSDATAIHSPDGRSCWVTSGHPSLSRGGSGDVLAGLLGGYLARGMEGFPAACLAVCLHGLAGRLAAAAIGEDAVTAGCLASFLPEAVRALRGRTAVFNPEREGMPDARTRS